MGHWAMTAYSTPWCTNRATRALFISRGYVAGRDASECLAPFKARPSRCATAGRQLTMGNSPHAWILSGGPNRQGSALPEASCHWRIAITEVGLRDGLQMEPEFIPTATKIALVNELVDAGVRHFEVTSFVSPRAVLQLRDAAEVLAGIERRPGVTLGVLAPNRKGIERKLAAGIDEIVVFLSASESHNRKNLNAALPIRWMTCGSRLIWHAGRGHSSRVRSRSRSAAR